MIALEDIHNSSFHQPIRQKGDILPNIQLLLRVRSLFPGSLGCGIYIYIKFK